jgi:hypothetical protein
MSADDAGKTEQRHIDIWKLPSVRDVRVERVKFDPARMFVENGRERYLREATAITIDTDGEIPVRSAAAILFVGEAQLTESERAGENRYRFYALEDKQLRDGAPIGLGWTGIAEPLEQTKFAFHEPKP